MCKNMTKDTFILYVKVLAVLESREEKQIKSLFMITNYHNKYFRFLIP